MTEEKQIPKEEMKEETKKEVPIETSKPTHETLEKKEDKKQSIQEKPKITEAIARGINLPISKKHSMYICKFIKSKPIEKALYDLKNVIELKQAVPFKGEIPHRKGMMSGRYPIKASRLFINILKSLKGNAIINALDLDKTRIVFASANWASRPARFEGRRAKRTHVILKAKEVNQV